MKELLMWWNLIFVLPFLGAIGLLLMQMAGLTGEHDHDVDHDMDHDADHDHDHDHDSEHDDAGPSILSQVLGVLGVGKAPLSVVIMTFCFVWGFVGWAGNVMLGPVLRFPAVYVPISIVAALFCGVTFTSAIARLLGRLLPSTSSHASTERDLVGKRGTVVNGATPTFGRLLVHDQFDNLHEVSCRTQGGNLPHGAGVVIVRYDEHEKMYEVRPDQLIESINR